MFASLGFTSGCQTKTGQFLSDCFIGPSPGEEAYTKAVMEDFQKTRQKHDEMFAEMRKENEEWLRKFHEENAPFYKAKAEYEEWYGALSVSAQHAVDSLLEQKLIHRRNIQGPNGVGVYDVWHDRFEIMAEYKEFFGH
ncbi:MAG: hypothetical protein IKX46_04780 [Verrucomicrobia bacterium]|nr:hypothetical protein [Verrucomicrobiota bacterium]